MKQISNHKRSKRIIQHLRDVACNGPKKHKKASIAQEKRKVCHLLCLAWETLSHSFTGMLVLDVNRQSISGK
jgi:hypothetical protein